MEVKSFDFLKSQPENISKDKYFEITTFMKFVNTNYGNWKVIKKFNDTGYNGNIYKVKDDTDRNGLLKLPRIRSGDSEGTSKQSLITEIKNLQQVSGHQNIQLILDCDTCEDNPFLVYEEIEGLTLQDIVKQKTISPHQAIQATINLLETVKFCHNKNIVHRDIKPDNIICRKNDIDDMVLIDFGLSTIANSSSETDWNRICCNRSLALPELFLGPNKADPRSDISYVCGGVLFYMLYGFLPRIMIDGTGNPPYEIDKARQISSSWPRNIQIAITDFLHKSFVSNICDRHQTIKEAQNNLQEILYKF